LLILGYIKNSFGVIGWSSGLSLGIVLCLKSSLQCIMLVY
jgi:hypothetical protein